MSKMRLWFTGLTESIAETETHVIYGVIGFIMFVSVGIVFLLDKVVYSSSGPQWLFLCLIIWWGVLIDIAGFISIRRKEVPRFPRYANIKGKKAVALGYLTVGLGSFLHLGVILSLFHQ